MAGGNPTSAGRGCRLMRLSANLGHFIQSPQRVAIQMRVASSPLRIPGQRGLSRRFNRFSVAFTSRRQDFRPTGYPSRVTSRPTTCRIQASALRRAIATFAVSAGGRNETMCAIAASASMFSITSFRNRSRVFFGIISRDASRNTRIRVNSGEGSGKSALRGAGAALGSMRPRSSHNRDHRLNEHRYRLNHWKIFNPLSLTPRWAT